MSLKKTQRDKLKIETLLFLSESFEIQFQWRFLDKEYANIWAKAFSYVPEIDFEAVYNETLQNYPNYDFEPFSKFGGFVNSHHFLLTIATSSQLLLVCVSPFMAFYFRREALKKLRKSINYISSKTLSQSNALLLSLSLQTVVPMVCYIPYGIFHYYNRITRSEIILGQYLFALMTTIPTITDPIFFFYFIAPYRKVFKQIFKFKSNPPEVKERSVFY